MRNTVDLSYHYWECVFRQEFGPQLCGIVDSLENRILPAYSEIEEEAKTVSKKTWEAFMSSIATGDEDPSDFAESAEQAGIAHYMLLNGIRQGMLNLIAIALHHAFEQQVILFLRRQMLLPQEVNAFSLFKTNVFRDRLNAIGIDITTFSSWVKIEELRLLANAAKHAEGDSARKLHLLRPDLFEHPQVSIGFFHISTPHVLLPLAGEDLYVSIIDVRQYRDSLLEFWEELLESLK